jgi:CPA2 family monovalent cation:H+ antiporter-2
MLAATSSHVALAFVELGLIVFGLAILARLSDRIGLSPIPAYLVAGLVFGKGGIVEPQFSSHFLELTAEIGVVLLLLTLGLEYTGDELASSVRRGWTSGAVDLAVNATPGLVIPLLLGWGLKSALLMAGITYVTSSGVVSKLLGDLGRMGAPETPAILTILVLEDLVMAIYLPIVGVLLAGEPASTATRSIVIAIVVIAAALFVAIRLGGAVTRLVAARTDEALLLGVLGLTLIVAGGMQRLDVSAAVAAFLVGIAISGSVRDRVEPLIAPIRDLAAAMFFLLFSLRIDPKTLPGALPVAILLAAMTALAKYWTGSWAAGRLGVDREGRRRAGTVLIAHGEFSIVIAGLALGAAVHEDLPAVAAAYVLILGIAGPLLARLPSAPVIDPAPES